MDTFTEWIDGLPDRDRLLSEATEALEDLAQEWIHHVLPGRTDLLAPIGDTEPEITFWMTAMLRFANWYKRPEWAWLLRRVPLTRMPTAALELALENDAFLNGEDRPPPVEPREHPQAVTLRNGWNSEHMLVTIAVPKTEMGHLHCDGGHLNIGWQGRFWITDPGYQQYRKGQERNYSIGAEAHNGVIINGKPQTRRDAKSISIEMKTDGTQRTIVDLSACYEGLPSGARIAREVWFQSKNGPLVVVKDSLERLPEGTEIQNCWLGGAFFAWAFRDGWARLSDGEHALWIGTAPGLLAADELHHCPGTRGPLTLKHSWKIGASKETRWWIFVCELAGNWRVPQAEIERDRLRLRLPSAETTVP